MLYMTYKKIIPAYIDVRKKCRIGLVHKSNRFQIPRLLAGLWHILTTFWRFIYSQKDGGGLLRIRILLTKAKRG